MTSRLAMMTLGILGLCTTAARAQPATMTWTPIDCAKSDIVLAGITKCEEAGPWDGSDARGQVHAQRAFVQSANERAYVYVFKPRITLMTGGVGGFSPEQREKWLSATKSAANFSPTLNVAGAYARAYTVPGGWQCFSFIKDGPPYGQSHGFAFGLYGFHCDKSQQAASPTVINAYVQGISVKP
jgi:hypothetical protein